MQVLIVLHILPMGCFKDLYDDVPNMDCLAFLKDSLGIAL